MNLEGNFFFEKVGPGEFSEVNTSRKTNMSLKTSCVVLSNLFPFPPLLGEDFQLHSYFSDGLKPPTR